jgi:L-ascorbate metabolism protein UlaG (beta-lactamase superfamily)
MSGAALTITPIGGPTALLELGGLRLLTDPTFDPAGTDYPTPVYTLRKTSGPALQPSAIGRVDAVLLSHDHHLDNLDRSGREMLASVPVVLTTTAGAERLGGCAVGLAAWQSVDLTATDGRTLRVTGTPARHGPADGDRGPVTGFVLAQGAGGGGVVYVSGDTVWYEGVAKVARRFSVRVAVLFMGAARVHEVGPANLTFTAAEAVEAARAFADATVVPLHYEGWAHFSESRHDIEAAFQRAGLQTRLRIAAPGNRVEFEL